MVNAALAIGIDVLIPLGWSSFAVASGSFVPTLLLGDRVVADTRVSGATPAHGHVVAFRHPRDPSMVYIKRVIGLPRDRIQLHNGILSINEAAVPREPEGDHLMNEAGIPISLHRYKETLRNGAHYSIVKASDRGEMNNTVRYVVPTGHIFCARRQPRQQRGQPVHERCRLRSTAAHHRKDHDDILGVRPGTDIDPGAIAPDSPI